MERKTRFELATLALARRCSTPEPLPHTLCVLHVIKLIGRGRWIRTTESSANGFTVRPLWPLGNPSIIIDAIINISHFLAFVQYFLDFFREFLFSFMELAEGITQMLRICRPCRCSAAASDISLIKSPPDFLTTLEPFRVRFLPFLWSWRRESNPQPADYKSAALPLSHASTFF